MTHAPRWIGLCLALLAFVAAPARSEGESAAAERVFLQLSGMG